jgi:hypothetical protein
VTLWLVFVLAFLGVAAVLWAGTVFFQGYIYSEPVSGLLWRAPVAALVLCLFVAFWFRLAYGAPGKYNTLFEFSARDDAPPFKQLWSVKKGKEILYVAKTVGQNKVEYRDSHGRPWSRSDAEGIMEAIIVEDKDGQKIRFDAELTKDGKFKIAPNESLRYVEAGGRHRVMTDDYIGRLSEVRPGMIAANLFLNFFLFVVWFIFLWLILRYQWGHAFGLAAVIWLVLTVTLLPMMFKKAEDLSRQRAGASQNAGLFPRRTALARSDRLNDKALAHGVTCL